MQKAVKMVLAAALFGGGLWMGSVFTSNADGLIPDNQPGSSNDPIVTKSYVDESVQKLVQEEVAKQTGSLPNGPGGSQDLVVVQLKAGQALFAGAGTEFIVRNGRAVAFSTDGNGIPDLTGGKDIPNGAEIANNHLLLFPKEGGRGIKPAKDTKGTIYVMVRGKYQVANEDGTPIN